MRRQALRQMDCRRLIQTNVSATYGIVRERSNVAGQQFDNLMACTRSLTRLHSYMAAAAAPRKTHERAEVGYITAQYVSARALMQHICR
jgi:hypothetical protein